VVDEARAWNKGVTPEDGSRRYWTAVESLSSKYL
jgi:hypothetical protein